MPVWTCRGDQAGVGEQREARVESNDLCMTSKVFLCSSIAQSFTLQQPTISRKRAVKKNELLFSSLAWLARRACSGSGPR